MITPAIETLGDGCLSIVFEERIAPDVNSRCVALAGEIQQRQLTGVRDVVAGFYTVAVYFDSVRGKRNDIRSEVERIIAGLRTARVNDDTDPVMIPVKYGGADGPDLSVIANFAGCSEEDAIRLHTEPEYRVYMLGFLPGFAYLGTVNQRIAMPRLESPRLKVLAGSVGIAGVQTGVYPCESPGGWRIIGRTMMKMFDVSRDHPSLLRPGDRVKFVAA